MFVGKIWSVYNYSYMRFKKHNISHGGFMKRRASRTSPRPPLVIDLMVERRAPLEGVA